MKYTFLFLFLAACAPMKSIKIHSNTESNVFVNGKSACPILPQTPCYINLKETDSSSLFISVQSQKNLFIKHYTLSGNMFRTDTSIFVKF